MQAYFGFGSSIEQLKLLFLLFFIETTLGYAYRIYYVLLEIPLWNILSKMGDLL